MSTIALIVIAKAPVPGRVKTRLTPPCTPAQAATLARAALEDTLEVVARTPARRRVLVLDGDPAGLPSDAMEVISQRGDGLGERLQAAFDDVGGPCLLVGMDTPQLNPGLLTGSIAALQRRDTDAVLGPSLDGGYWTIGLPGGVSEAFAGVPMSVASTGDHQRRRLAELGLRVRLAPALRDVDTIADARRVAGQAPHTRFARALAAIR